MSNDNAPSDPRGEQSAKALIRIRALAVQLRMASRAIDSLWQVSGDIFPVVTAYGPDGMTGEELDPVICACEYFIDHTLGVLESNFTSDVKDALKLAGVEAEFAADDDGDEEPDPAPVDAPAVREAVPSGGKPPYWLA